MKVKKLIAAAYTPLHQDGSLNTSKIKDYSKFLTHNKVSGVFINGSTGDFASLSISERKQITLAWSENKSKNLYLIDHVGHTNLREAKELAVYASDKVDAIAVLAPYYFRLNTIEKLIQYCKEIAASAPNIPFYYYHIPVLSGAHFNMEKFLKMAETQIPNLEGIKFTNNNLIDYQHSKRVSNGRFKILFGYDELFLNSLVMGSTGWVGSTYNHLAPLYNKIQDFFDKGQIAQAQELQIKAIKFVEILDSKGGFNGVAKGFMKELGIDCGPSRFPHTTLNADDYIIIKKELDAIGLTNLFSKFEKHVIP